MKKSALFDALFTVGISSIQNSPSKILDIMPAGGDWKDLFGAVQRGDMDTVRYHILMGIDPNYQHPEYLTNPLIEAVRYEQLEIVKYLLENGAKADVTEVWTGEPLTKIAKLTGNKVIIKLIKSQL